MILRAKDGIRGRVTDLDTGKDLRHLVWVDLDSGHFECYQTVADGSLKTDQHGNFLTVLGVGRFRFTPRDSASAFKCLEGAESCGVCKSPLTLPGSDLCAVCKAGRNLSKQDRSTRECFDRPRAERLPAVSLTNRCHHRGCSSVATWLVADESPASFVKGRLKGKVAWFARGMTVARRSYCDRHYQPPRLLDERGEVIERLENVGPASARSQR